MIRKLVSVMLLAIGFAFLATSTYTRISLPTRFSNDPIESSVADSNALMDRSFVPEPLLTFPLDRFRVEQVLKQRYLNHVVAASVSKNMGDPAVAVHALRLRGHAVKNLEQAERNFFDDELKLLTDDRVFREFGSGLPVLMETAYGAGYRTRSRSSVRLAGSVGAIAEGGMTHVDIMLCVLGELGVGLDYPVVTTTDRVMTLADVLEDSMQRFSFDRELDFSLVGFCCYLRQPEWTTSLGSIYTVDGVAEALLQQPAESGACIGTHRIYAIAKYCMWARRFPEFAASHVKKRGEDHLKDVSRHLVNCQNEDGSWDGNWYIGLSKTATPKNKDHVGQYNDKIRVTGHILEWCAIVPPELRPPPDVIVLAASYLAQQLVVNRDDLYNSNLLPVTHVIRALLNLSEPDAGV